MVLYGLVDLVPTQMNGKRVVYPSVSYFSEVEEMSKVVTVTATATTRTRSVREIDYIEIGPKVVVVIPAYNEERFIGTTVLQARKFSDTVIVVDDGSKDATADVARLAGAIVVQHQQNSGKGVAVETAFRKAREYNPDVVVMMDADGQHVADELPRVIKPVLDGEADIVVGSRYLEPTSDVPVHRVLGHRVFNTLTNQASGVNVTDSQSGFRAFSARAFQVLSFRSDGFSVECEMQFLAREHALRVAEVPITILYHDKPKRSVVKHGLMVLDGLLRLVGQYRPLFFFGGAGVTVLLVGFLVGAWVINIYQQTQTLAVGYALINVLLIFISAFLIFTGFILHSVRGMLIGHKSAETKTTTITEA